MSYDIDKFVNTNKVNVSFDDESDEVQSELEFEKLVQFNEIDSTAFPVLIYKMNNEPVAWYDLERFVGSIQK
jgi:hypothetical protein